jgi:transcription-repair coupling factor (superfamily II helicase)
MQLSGISSLLARLPALDSLTDRSDPVRAYGLLSAAKPAVLAALRSRLDGPLLIVAAHPHRARELSEELPAWTGRSVSLFPAIESLPYERVHLDRTLVSQRERLLQDMDEDRADIVVAPARALLQPVRGVRASLEPVEVHIGDTIAIESLLTGWVARGYESVSLVDEPGTFARRGGVIDIFPSAARTPVRIELFGNEIDSLRAFDPSTQRSLHPVETLIVPPIASLGESARLEALERLLAADTSNLTAEAQTLWMDDLARLEAGAGFDELAAFGPYLVERPCSLVEHLPPTAVVVVDEAAETWRTMEDLARQAVEVQRGLEESGTLPRGLEPALLPVHGVSAAMRARRTVEFFSGTPEDPHDLDLTGLFVPARLYAGRLRALTHDLKEDLVAATVIVTAQDERIAELLAEDGVAVRRSTVLAAEPSPGVTLVPHGISEGWALPRAGLSVLSDHELFGRARTRPVVRRTRAPRESFFARFAPGDFVVHLEHGIGRFDGVTRMTIEGVEREYALVQYAGTDRVYVPTDQLERLTRYVGMGESTPPLNKLGGGEWQRARARAKAAAADIARELIDVYAKRMARPAHAFAPDSPWQHELESSFAYPETPDQLRAVEEVKTDMEEPRPMDRLVCADVGYGKTEVAVRAAFKAVTDGKQVAVLVPTTILAQQHYETFCERFAPFPVVVEVLSRFRSPAQQRDILRRVASGEVDVVIGTHRLLSKDVHFKKLGLLVVDEEQRFGVKHKEQLKRFRESMDVLTLTATPIPRTLNMGLVGIREISIIETPPEGRLPIKTYLQPFEDRLIREAVLRELDREGQVYLVHNKVASIEAIAARVRDLVPEARVVVAHGQMDEALLEKVMLTFAHREADVLICSTIIENGLDIPNVNTIIVNNAHRLGLTQLYQLRGRVGRSANQAYAYLLYPRDVRLSRDAVRRMEAVFEAQELGAGLNIAMTDLEIRGVGNLLGAEQSGHAVAIGFDLYTRMIGEAVERLRGVPVQEPSAVTIDLPLTMFLPAEYIGGESERLTLYRRLAAVDSVEELEALEAEIADRFGKLPLPVQNLITSVHIKLMARAAGISSLSLSGEALILRAEPNALYDRIALYRTYGSEARISTNVLRISRHAVPADWVPAVEKILEDMVSLKRSLAERQAAPA